MSTTAGHSAELTLLDARGRYFERNGFGEDGGYSADWVTIDPFGIPFRFPNTQGRRRAVRYHDLHHVLTGYATDMRGEAEISAWELATGCKEYTAAWILNGLAFGYGLLVCPRRARGAFIWGLNTRNLYGRDYEGLLGRRVDEVELELDLGGSPEQRARCVAQASGRQRLIFGLAALVTLTPYLLIMSSLIVLLAAWMS